MGISTEEALKQKKTGRMPTGRRWKGIPVPFFFIEESAEAFARMEMRDDDVILSSLGKGGTTWVHKVLFLLLNGMDETGKRVAAVADSIGANGQIYPEGCPKIKPDKPGPLGHMFCLDDLYNQPSPRMISTHLWGQHLPKQLLNPKGKGKVGTIGSRPHAPSPPCPVHQRLATAHAIQWSRALPAGGHCAKVSEGCLHISPLHGGRGQGWMAGQRARSGLIQSIHRPRLP